MAKFCGKDCEEVGSICDFCIHYQDEYRDIQNNGLFAGEGICDIDGSETDAASGYNCENYECFRVYIED